jgi:type IV pilus assembly protein PilA
MKQGSKGFTLIELMIVIAIIAILASLAVSAYQTYTVRAQVAEGMNFAAGAKVPIVDALTNAGIAPADLLAAGMDPNPASFTGSYVSTVNIVGGRVDVTFGGLRAHQDIVGMVLSLTPYETPGNTIVWRCGNAAIPPSGVPLSGGAPHVQATVDPRYLPKVCRQ